MPYLAVNSLDSEQQKRGHFLVLFLKLVLWWDYSRFGLDVVERGGQQVVPFTAYLCVINLVDFRCKIIQSNITQLNTGIIFSQINFIFDYI